MYNKRVRYALDHFIMDRYFLPMSNTYHLKEEEESGKSDLNVTVINRNLCICGFDKKKRCDFLRTERKYGMQKCVDHILFEEQPNGWRLHLIEMKSSVGYKTWIEKIKPKVRTSYFTALAIANFLGIRVREAVAYTTFEEEKFGDIVNKANLKAKVPELGKVARDAYTDEWTKNRLFLDIGEEMQILHKRIKMVKNEATGTLEGILVLDNSIADE